MACPDCGQLDARGYLFTSEDNKEAIGELYLSYMREKEEDRIFYKRKNKVLKDYNPSQLVPYDMVFSKKEPILFTFDNVKYYVIDSYCIMPNCRCTVVGLNIFGEDDTRKVKTPLYFFLFDYDKEMVSEPTNIDLSKAKEIAQTLKTGMMVPFKKRHEKLKNELKQDVEAMLQKDKNITKRKIGRNEPCHCGSGIKYKKCCLYKDTEETGKAKK